MEYDAEAMERQLAPILNAISLTDAALVRAHEAHRRLKDGLTAGLDLLEARSALERALVEISTAIILNR